MPRYLRYPRFNTGIMKEYQWERDFAHFMLSISERRALAKLAPATSYVMGISMMKTPKKKQLRLKRKYASE